MDNLLRRQPVSMSRFLIHESEECVVNGECNLPDYCPDIAVVLKCMMTPYVQNRQWSGDQLLVDGIVHIRVLYLDEDRRCPRSVEFCIPFSCPLHSQGRVDMTPVELTLSSKYINCRAVGPRRLEVRGAINIAAKAEIAHQTELAFTAGADGLHTKMHDATISYPIGAAEKILTINDALEFSDNLPPAEILLGGECRAVVQECKMLTGKAIVKGYIYIHQLYAADAESGDCRCLDYVIPFSQILDVEGMEEGMPCCAAVQILSDTQRCVAGPDGDNSVLEIMVKLLVQLHVHRCNCVQILTDAYHTAYPITPMKEEISLCATAGTRWEKAVLPMKVALPAGQLQHIIDVWIEKKEVDTQCRNGVVAVKGRWFVCVLARDVDGQVVYHEYPEEYCLEFAGSGSHGQAELSITELHYRVIDDQLELQVEVCTALTLRQEEICPVIQELKLHTDQPYSSPKTNLILYFAEPGESVWDIGSCCHTSPECICAENDLECDAIATPTVMLVPIEQ